MALMVDVFSALAVSYLDPVVILFILYVCLFRIKPCLLCTSTIFRHCDQGLKPGFSSIAISSDNAMAGVEALIDRKAFKAKETVAETLLIDFDLYMKTVKNFFISTGKDTATNISKVAMLQAVGGSDMVDLVEEVGKVILVAIVANGLEAVTADTFEQAIDKIRQGIVGKTNQAMSRLKVYQQIRQGMQKFGPWYKEVLKQAKSLLLFAAIKKFIKCKT